MIEDHISNIIPKGLKARRMLAQGERSEPWDKR